MANRTSTRSLAAACTTDQWLRCSHTDTALDLSTATVSLGWDDPPAAVWTSSVVAGRAGLCFDPGGCLYHGDLSTGQVQWIAWAPADALLTAADQPAPVDLLAPPPPTVVGPFQPTAPPAPALEPAGLAVDFNQHLFVLDGVSATIWVFDLDSRVTFRHIALEAPIAAVTAAGSDVLVALSDRTVPLVRMAARTDPVPVTVPPAALVGVAPDALPVDMNRDGTGRIWMLWRSPSGDSWAVPVVDDRTTEPIGPLPFASALAIDGDGNIVIAGPPGDDFCCFGLETGLTAELAPLEARGYDGRGIVRTPDGRIGFWTSNGFRLAVSAQVAYRSTGHVDVFEFDGGQYRMRWGRVFLDACIPDGTSVTIACVTSDDIPGPLEPTGDSIPRTLPVNVLPSSPEVPLATPPLVSVDLAPSLATTHPVQYREVGRELPWLARDAGDQFKTYEGMVNAEPGRYLFVRLVLTGNAVYSPRVRGLRVEYPGTDWPSRLPEVYSEDPDWADFLFRFLSLPDGIMADLDARSAQRDLLLNAFSAPPEALGWIASLFGLSLDGRWSVASQRELLSEVCCLWRRRGTLGALTRMLEIYLGVPPVIVEAWRMRAVGGGGIGGGLTTDDFAPFAHRFSVIIPLLLDDTQVACVTDLLDRYKPAHTLYEMCTVGAGMRVGLGLHVAITSIVWPSAGWKQFELNVSRLGTDVVIGRPEQGFRPGGSRVGVDSRTDT